MKYSNYTPQEDQIIISNFRTKTYQEIAKMINRSPQAIRSHVKDTLKLSRTKEDLDFLKKKYGNIGHFKKGLVPWNSKEEKAISIRKDPRGIPFKFIRVCSGVWERLHVYNWRKAFGPIPKTHVLVCKTEDTLNTDLSNWELITKQENLNRNRWTNQNKTYEHTCVQCRETFSSKSPVTKFCSHECNLASKRVTTVYEERECPRCGIRFTPNTHKQKYCSSKCRERFHRNVTEYEKKTCKKCGESFTPTYGNQLNCPDCRGVKKARPCRECGTYFMPKHGNQLVCSPCKNKQVNKPAKVEKSKNKPVKISLAPRNCVVCGGVFTPTRKDQVKCPEHRKVKLSQKKLRSYTKHQDQPATRMVTSVIIPAAAKPEKKEEKVLVSPDLGNMQYRYYDPKLRQTFFFRTQEKLERFKQKMETAQ